MSRYNGNIETCVGLGATREVNLTVHACDVRRAVHASGGVTDVRIRPGMRVRVV